MKRRKSRKVRLCVPLTPFWTGLAVVLVTLVPALLRLLPDPPAPEEGEEEEG